jgi:hypothetical protein
MGRRRCQIHFVVTASGRARAPRCFAAQGADCCFSRSVFPFSKVLKQCRSQGLPDRKAGNPSARHILAGIIAPAKAPRCPLASRGTKAPGKRPPGRAQAFCWSRTCRSAGHRRAREGEPRVAFPSPARTDESTVTAAMAGAIAPATVLRPYQDQPGAQSPRPAPAPPPAGASRPPGRALASAVPGPAGPQGTVARGRRKRGSRFLIPPALAKALPPLQWQGPSPLPQCHAGIRTGRGPKPPASARPAPGGRFAPAGPGAGLLLVPDLPVHRAPFRGGGGNAGRVS